MGCVREGHTTCDSKAARAPVHAAHKGIGRARWLGQVRTGLASLVCCLFVLVGLDCILISAHCARRARACSGVDARPTNRTRREFRPLDDQNWRRCTTPKGEASPGKPSTGAPHHPAFGVRAHLCAHSGHARTKHVMCCARLSTRPKPTMPPRTAHPFRLSKGEITRAAFA